MRDTIDMAREVFDIKTDHRGRKTFSADSYGLEEFATLVRADEREACAKVCDVLAVHPEYASDITKLAAAAIRARGNT